MTKESVAARLKAMDRVKAVERLWDGDATLWGKSGDAAEAVLRGLGWLDVPASMVDHLPEISDFAAGVRAAGFDTLLFSNAGGSIPAVELFRQMAASDQIASALINDSEPASVKAAAQELGDKRLHVLSSKLGTRQKVLGALDALWKLDGDGSHYVAITDPGADLVELAEERRFRRVFLNRRDVPGQYSILSWFGLVPAALLGVDVRRFLRSASAMATACRVSRAENNPGAVLGATLAKAAIEGQEIGLECSLGLRAFGDWVARMATEAGLRVTPAAVPSDGRWLQLRISGELALSWTVEDPHDMGGECFRWQFATALVGAVLGLNAFDGSGGAGERTPGGW